MIRHYPVIRFDAPRQQRGVVLVVALIFLLLVTMLAISASGTSLLQQFAGGQRNAQLAEWSAETAIRAVEWRLWRSSSDPSAQITCGSGVYRRCYSIRCHRCARLEGASVPHVSGLGY